MQQLKRLAFVVLLCLGVVAQGAAQVGKNLGLLDPNTASETELSALAELNPQLVQGILAQRPFLRIIDLNGYLSSKLSQEQLTGLYRKLFVGIDLNSASKEEILLIPGVGNRLLHEFEEYRPYDGLAEFRREIGKYVKPDELARLEQYVFLPIKLNTATDEEILGIPGIGKRMLHEFKEYRPYQSIEQFRREIGKYVSPREVARLERYVSLR